MRRLKKFKKGSTLMKGFALRLLLQIPKNRKSYLDFTCYDGNTHKDRLIKVKEIIIVAIFNARWSSPTLYRQAL